MTRGPEVPAELRGVAHRVVHARDATLVHEVDDELQLVQALEVGHLRLVPGLDENLEAGLHQLLGAAAQHGLLAEEVGLGLFLEVGLQHAGTSAADGLGVAQRERLSLAGRVLVDRNERRDTLAVDELAADQVARALRCDHADGDVGRRLDEPEVDVEAMAEEQRVALVEVRFDVLGEDLGLAGVRRQQHDDVGPSAALAG